MKHTFVLRVAGDICFWYAILSVFDLFRPWRLPMALFVLTALALGLFLVRLKKGALRGALAALPVFWFLLGPLEVPLLLPLVGWGYYLAAMARGDFALPLYEYRKRFTVMLALCLFFLAANAANATLYRGQVFSVESLLYAFAFLLLGVTAMRRMQMGARMPLKWHINSLLSAVGVPLAAAGVSLALFMALRFSHEALRFLLEPVGRFLLWLFHKLFPDGHSPIEELTLQDLLTPRTPTAQPEVPYEGGGAVESALKGSGYSPLLIDRAAGIGAWVLLAVLLLLALWAVVHHVRRVPFPAEEEAVADETEDAPGPGPKRRRKAVSLSGNARQLRRVYKTYLEYRQAKGFAVSPSDTSGEILRREQDLGDPAGAERLRELYIAARYGDPAQVTREQVREAQECLERLIWQGKQAL